MICLDVCLSLRLPCFIGIYRWYSEKMVAKIIVGSTGLAALLLIILMQSTAPSTAGPIGLLAVFFLIYIITIGLMTEVLWVGSRVFQSLAQKVTTKRPPARISLVRAYYFSTVLALGPVILLAMQSIGSLGVYEVVLVVIFVAVGFLYISRR